MVVYGRDGVKACLLILSNRGKYIAIYKKIIELLIREITRNRCTLGTCD